MSTQTGSGARISSSRPTGDGASAERSRETAASSGPRPRTRRVVRPERADQLLASDRAVERHHQVGQQQRDLLTAEAPRPLDPADLDRQASTELERVLSVAPADMQRSETYRQRRLRRPFARGHRAALGRPRSGQTRGLSAPWPQMAEDTLTPINESQAGSPNASVGRSSLANPIRSSSSRQQHLAQHHPQLLGALELTWCFRWPRSRIDAHGRRGQRPKAGGAQTIARPRVQLLARLAAEPSAQPRTVSRCRRSCPARRPYGELRSARSSWAPRARRAWERGRGQSREHGLRPPVPDAYQRPARVAGPQQPPYAATLRSTWPGHTRSAVRPCSSVRAARASTLNGPSSG